MDETENFLYKPYSLAVVPRNSFFQCSDGRKGKVLERKPEENGSLVRWQGGLQDFVNWNNVKNLEFKKLR